MARLFEIGLATLFIGGVVLAKAGWLDEAAALVKPAAPPAASGNPWSSDYVPGPAEPIVHYRNCDAARRAGAAPIRTGEPGYRPELDRDNDGIACEPYRGR
jgi:hypothetical protein